MKNSLLALAVVLVFGSFVVIAQDQLPEYGNVADLNGMTKVYVATDSTDVRKFILGELKKAKSLEVVASPDQGQFILECKQTGHIATSSDLFREMPTFEMIAYTITNARRKIAWSATKTSVRYPPTLLTRDFINALKKARGEKK
jgi:hypothetical protein